MNPKIETTPRHGPLERACSTKPHRPAQAGQPQATRMSNRILQLVTCVALASTAALAQQAPEAPGRRVAPAQNSAPPGPPPNLGDLMRANGGDLRQAALQMAEDPRTVQTKDVNYFYVPEAKPKTLAKHDLVTIIISEQSQFSSDGSTDTKKDAGIDLKLEQFPKINIANFALENAIGGVTPQLKASANRDFKGEGTVDRKDTFTTRIQAEVVDVKNNGDLILQARSRVVTDEEERLLILSGRCRALDITPDNTVLSSQLYDKDLRVKNSGAVRDSTKRGWVPRLLDWANPF